MQLARRLLALIESSLLDPRLHGIFSLAKRLVVPRDDLERVDAR
jgi:hypothetical protein